MNIGIVIVCRFASQRLPGKILHEIHGRTVLGHIVDRLRRGNLGYSIVVATSKESSDDKIAAYCRRSDLACFRGSLDDVAGRLLACAEHYGWDYVVRINGDNLFADPALLHSMLAVAQTGTFDLITNVPGRTFPYGISIEILRTSFFRTVLESLTDQQHREHVTSWLYENEDVGQRYVVVNREYPEAAGLQLALDTSQDLQRYTDMFNLMDRHPATYTLPEIVHLATHAEQSSPWRGKYGPLLIAEIGGNHEGNFDVARDLARQAIATGVDYVKFQLYRGDTLVSPLESPDRNNHFKKFELTQEQHLELAQMCREAGVGYLASVWDLEMLEWIDPYLDMYKIGSGDLTAWPILRAFAKRGKPIILSTGLATLDEVMQAVSRIQAIDSRYASPRWLCLLQCTSMYPIVESEANLRVMDTLRQAMGVAVGYSDHTETGLALRTAAAMGADVLEFHFTDSRGGKVFRDHKVSLTPNEVKLLQEDLRRIQTVRGSNVKLPQPSEIEQGHVTSFRRGVYLNRSVAQGERIRPEDLVTLRPNHGLDARDADLLPGAKAEKPLQPYNRLDWDSIQAGIRDE
jgi:sialic acid synthase SpsE/spore coat polysaccharide biosynthesis protein SpsF (cytidylyltransferase family)